MALLRLECNGIHTYQNIQEIKLRVYTNLLRGVHVDHSGKTLTKELPDPGCSHSNKHLIKFRPRSKEEWYLCLTSDGLG